MAMAMAKSVAAIKSTVYSVQLSLLEGISDEDKLHAAGKVLTQSEYADVLTERSIVDMCGYPLCTTPLPSTFPHKGRYHISLREHKVYDLQETRLFCSSDCLVASKSFAASLALERDHSTKTLELAASFHNLGIQDVNPLATEKPPLLIQELDEQCHRDTPIPVDPSIPNETAATQQARQLNPGNFLLIHEQNEIKVTDVNAAGPSDAIEGYIPQKEVWAFRHNMDEEASVQNTGRQRSKRQNRVSWADHNNLNLVEELSPSNAASGSGILIDTCNLRVHEDSNQAVVPDVLTSKKGAVAIKGRSGLLQRQEAFRARKEQEDTSRKAAVAGRSSALLQTQEIPCCRKEHEDIQGTIVHNEEGDQAVMPDMVTSVNIADPVGGIIASPQRQEHVGGREEPENIHENLECTKALVTALTEAADAVAHGEVDSSEAVARAGISILPKHEVPSSLRIKEMKDSGKELEDDVENIDPRDCWYSAPPKDFKPELSMFGTLWMALDGWISAASIAHVYGKDSNEEDNFAFINGKEYLRQVIVPNGVAAEIERTLAGCISRTLPGLAETLRLPVPVSTLEVSLGRFLRTMSFMTAIPAFSSKQWQVVVLLLLDGLSVHRLPTLRTRFLNGRHMLQKVLASANITEAEYEIFRDLVLPMGMLPDFAAHCGG